MPVLNDNQNEHLFNVMKRLDKFAEVITFVVYTSCDFHPNILVKALPCNLNYKLSQYIFNPLTPLSDQDRISPYYICTVSCRQVMRIKKNLN